MKIKCCDTNQIFIVLFICVLIFGGCNLGEEEPEDVPQVETISVTNVNETFVECSGQILTSGSSAVEKVGFCATEFYNSTAPIDCISEVKTQGDSFSMFFTDLLPNTTYSIWATADNYYGKGYGNRIEFTTLEDDPSTVFDICLNEYLVDTIGSQIWLVGNLRVWKLNNGKDLDLVSEPQIWDSESGPAFCYYDNDFEYNNPYGILYNWHAVSSGKLCPEGWHVPSDDEWSTLINSLGAQATAALKEAGADHWEAPNYGTNVTGFTAVPAGDRSGHNGSFNGMSTSTFWWTSTEYDDTQALFKSINHNSPVFGNFANKKHGYSVRCIKD